MQDGAINRIRGAEPYFASQSAGTTVHQTDFTAMLTSGRNFGFAGSTAGFMHAAGLTDTQIRILAQRFDPEHMAPAAYSALLDELCGAGILTLEDKTYVMYDTLAARDESAQALVRVTPTGGLRMNSIRDSGGNIRDWARSRSAWLACDVECGMFYPDRAAVIFSKISRIFDLMQDIS